MDRDDPIEEIILRHCARGMDRVRRALEPGYCARAARMALAARGRVLIGTGFPVAGSFETDGPIGAIALYQALETLGAEPLFGCAPPISRVLAARYRVHEIPLLSWDETMPLAQKAAALLAPRLVVAIERPGVARDGRYYNMRGEEITDRVAKFDLFLAHAGCPTIAVGDGGNEIGMGKVLPALAALPIIPAVTSCDELVVATVSNWGVYGIIAAMGREIGEDLLGRFDPEATVRFLLDGGAVDGLTGCAVPTEDGFPLEVGRAVIEALRACTAASRR